MFGITEILHSLPPIIKMGTDSATVTGLVPMTCARISEMYNELCSITKLERITLGHYACGPEMLFVYTETTRSKILHISFDPEKQHEAELEISHITFLIHQDSRT